MDLVLTRKQLRSDGIFSQIVSSAGDFVCETLEHAYLADGGLYAPKIPTGYYQCLRGKHELEGMKEPFETFEITGVPDHTGLLFHSGNFNNDSRGCVLVGEMIAKEGDIQRIINSRKTFRRFMALQNGADTFYLKVDTD